MSRCILQSEGTELRADGIDAPRPVRRKELDRHRARFGVRFVSQHVNVIPADVHESHACGVDVWCARWVVGFVSRHCTQRNDD